MSISLAREWELEGGTPKLGQRLPVMDHRGRRHGTVEVVRIAVMPFGEVDAGSVEEHERPDRRGLARRTTRLLRPLPRAGRCVAGGAGVAVDGRRAAGRAAVQARRRGVAPPNVNGGWVGVVRLPSTSITGPPTPSRSTLTAYIAVNVDLARPLVQPIHVDGNSIFPTQRS